MRHGDQEQRTRCQATLMETVAYTDHGPLWILGSPFFRRYYTTFKVGQMGKHRGIFIARASSDCYPESVPHPYSIASYAHEVHERKVNMSMIQVPDLAHRAA